MFVSRWLPSCLQLSAPVLALALSAGGCDSGAEGGEDEAAEEEEASDDGEDTGGCPTGQTICDDACTDLNTDANHCGSCGWACEAGAQCIDALCVAACTGGELSCGGTCVDVSSSDEHCGDCDDPCAPGTHCEGGECACGDPVSFATDVLPLLTDGCNGENCHDSIDPSSNLDLSGDVISVLLDVPVNQCGSGVRVSAGNVEGSYLMNKLLGNEMCQGERMPRNNPALPNADLAKIANWICHGAENN